MQQQCEGGFVEEVGSALRRPCVREKARRCLVSSVYFLLTPTPPPPRSFGIIAVAENSRQIFAEKRVSGKISETNELERRESICCLRDISTIVLHSRKRCQGNTKKFWVRSAGTGSLLLAGRRKCGWSPADKNQVDVPSVPKGFPSELDTLEYSVSISQPLI